MILSKLYWKPALSAVIYIIFYINNILGQPKDFPDDWVNGRPESCTVVLVGRNASVDGSVMNSHTDDSRRDRNWMDITSPKDFPKGSMMTVRKRFNNDSTVMPSYQFLPIGEIPQVEHTFGYINTTYPCMNEHQLAAGESTFGGRETLKSDGLIDCYQLVYLVMERCKTAREAVELTRELLGEYGWNDYGECLTFSDPKEVWMVEIVGPGKGSTGAVWAAQRVPDDQVSVNANGSRIRQIDLKNPDFFRASSNVFKVAQDSGWWNPADGPFEFCYAYDPGGRQSFATRRREWRVLSILAPSLNLHPDAENFPFSVKPDTLVTLEKMVRIFQDYYEGTEFDMRKTLTWVNAEGKTEICPLASPFMPYDMNKMLRINGGWGWLGERTIARWYTNYATITQSRDWLPDEVGGVVWLAWDNAAASVYVPIYCSVLDVPQSYKIGGRIKGFNRESAWWAFNRLSGLASQRWGDMSKDVRAVWRPMQKELFDAQYNTETIALELLRANPHQARKFLTQYFINWGDKVVERAWKLGDELWTKYDEQF